MKNKPPKIANWLLKKFLKSEDNLNRIDDFEEVYQNIAGREGRFKAVIWYWFEVFGTIPQILTFSIYWSFTMFKNYLKTALRNIRKHKGYTFINVTGLTIGLACCIFLFIWVKDELSYDKYHINGDRVYRLILGSTRAGSSQRSSFTAPRAPIGLKEEFPEIEEAARFKILGNIKPDILVKYNEKMFNETRLAFGDASLFKMFTFQFILGSAENPYNSLNSIVLSEKLAAKYFENQDPIGKILTVENKYKYTVTGIIKDIPHNCHLQFDLIIPFEHIENYLTYYGKFLESYGLHFFNNYIMVSENLPFKEINEKVKNYYPDKFERTPFFISLQPVKDIHLRSKGIRDFEKRGDIQYVYIFSLTGIFILIIACINFVNLTTAQSGIRAKEIGMRKVMGATRENLIRQFFTETLIFSFFALFIALCLVYVLMPFFNSISGKQLSFDISGNLLTAAGIITITLISGALSGIYPALFLSSVRPLKILKGVYGSEKGGSFLRKGLVVIQFVVAVSLIICTIMIFRQFMFIQKRDLGYDKDHFIYVSLYGQLKEKYELAKNEMLKNSNIPAVTISSSIMSRGAYAGDNLHWEGKNYDKNRDMFSFVSVDKDFIETFNIEMAQGTSFAKNPPKKTNEEIIINETAAKMIDIDPIIGLGAKVPGGPDAQIIGVVKDYHFMSLHNEIRPLVISMEPPVFRYFLIKIKPENMQSTLDYIRGIFTTIEPEYPFEYHFMDESYEALYSGEKQMRIILEIFTVIAIFVSCLGLVGLSSFTAESRTKEIGIRKVLGASIADIMRLLSNEYLLLVIISNIIAWPVSYYFITKWVQDFAYRTDINIFVFVYTGIIILFITLIAVGWQTVKASTANPVDSLKNE
ncbi:ABC transporter permease [candidate division KSB1 bacterium]